MNRSLKKERLRKDVLERRRAMPFEEVYSLSARVQKRLLESVLYAGARRLSLYSSFQNEVLTDDVFRAALKDGKEVYYPRVVKGGARHLAFLRVRDLSELSVGTYEILEPGDAADTAPAEDFDLVVVPGAAFDVEGGRLGYGKGYYDMALSRAQCPIVALAYDFQVLNELIPVEPHDVKVSAVVTEKRVLKVRAGR